jgi:hypothetical protein
MYHGMHSVSNLRLDMNMRAATEQYECASGVLCANALHSALHALYDACGYNVVHAPPAARAGRPRPRTHCPPSVRRVRMCARASGFGKI